MRYETLYEKVHTGSMGFKHIELKTGRRISFIDAERKSEYAISTLVRWVSRMFKLVGEHKYSQYDIDAIDHLCYRLETLIGAWRHELNKRNVRKTKEERIALLRKTRGRTKEEAAAYLAKAEQLERELDS